MGQLIWFFLRSGQDLCKEPRVRIPLRAHDLFVLLISKTWTEFLFLREDISKSWHQAANADKLPQL